MEEFARFWYTLPLTILLHLLFVRDQPALPSCGRPNWMSPDLCDQLGQGTIADEFAYEGEPWTAEARRRAAYGAWVILGLFALALMFLEPRVAARLILGDFVWLPPIHS